MRGVQRSSAVMVDTVVPKTRMDWLTATYHNTPGGSSNALLAQPVATWSAFIPIGGLKQGGFGGRLAKASRTVCRTYG